MSRHLVGMAGRLDSAGNVEQSSCTRPLYDSLRIDGLFHGGPGFKVGAVQGWAEAAGFFRLSFLGFVEL